MSVFLLTKPKIFSYSSRSHSDAEKPEFLIAVNEYNQVFLLKKLGFSPQPGVSPGKISGNAAIKVICIPSYVQRKGALTLNSGDSVEASSPEETGCGGLGAVTPSTRNETAINPPYKAVDRLRVPSPTH
ncbi:hypothetical protein QUA54_10590 [Microcoleus sp. MOSTC5]|uniref:hypothetical protein n=1 Tax=Microcoleus sp. MOSTC5 TaxID=3055378 RepID=UPI002FD14192